MSLPRGFKAWCENVALQIRRELGLAQTARLDPRQLASHLDIEVRTPYDIPGLDQSCIRRLVTEDSGSWSAVTLSSGEKDLVLVNPSHSRGRQANDLMHELAHILLGHEAARVDVAEDGSLVLFTYDKEQEDEANWLAACLLLPRAALLAIRKEGGDLHASAREYGVSQAMLQYRLNVTGVEHQMGQTTRRAVNRGISTHPKSVGD